MLLNSETKRLIFHIYLLLFHWLSASSAQTILDEQAFDACLICFLPTIYPHSSYNLTPFHRSNTSSHSCVIIVTQLRDNGHTYAGRWSRIRVTTKFSYHDCLAYLL